MIRIIGKGLNGEKDHLRSPSSSSSKGDAVVS